MHFHTLSYSTYVLMRQCNFNCSDNELDSIMQVNVKAESILAIYYGWYGLILLFTPSLNLAPARFFYFHQKRLSKMKETLLSG
jgi:hypothetical protein